MGIRTVTEVESKIMNKHEKAIISNTRMTGVEAIIVFLGALVGFQVVMQLRLRKLKRIKDGKK